ncbi:tRNA (N6-isopentenyl adenosine(37)-C2)-methylthiotransferase MiaB [Gemmatimonadota bacterium]
MTGKKKAYVETYGCQMNISDGELMSGILQNQGYELVESPEEADVVLVNTCAIREHAEQRVLGRVSQLNGLKGNNPNLLLGVTGCMAQRMGKNLQHQAPYVDLVMGPDGYRGLGEALQGLSSRPTLVQLEKAGAPRQASAYLDLDPRETYEGLERRRSSGVSAWVPVQRGCDHKCTFCIVPFVRGPEKNRPPGSILDEVRKVAAEGISEVTLLGQTVNSYRNEDWDFPRLLGAVARIPGIRRVRFTSPHPKDVTPALVDVMAGEGAVCEQLHLPLQAGNDRTLKRMLRRHSVDEFVAKVDLVRSSIPEIALSTDVIVAFPGETEEEFLDTLGLVRQIRFDEAFTYRYSPREGTPATRFPAQDTVPPEVGRAWLDELIRVTREIQAEINRAEVGRVEEVLVEKEGKEAGFMLGRTRRNKVVVFEGDPTMSGSYREVRLDRTTGATFVGTLCVAPTYMDS